VVKELNHGDVDHKEHSDEFKQNNAKMNHIVDSELETSKPKTY
jgi:hypothetical protein